MRQARRRGGAASQELGWRDREGQWYPGGSGVFTTGDARRPSAAEETCRPQISHYRCLWKQDFVEGGIVDGHAIAGVLYPTFEDTWVDTVKDGKVVKRQRPADVKPYAHEGDAVVDPGAGTSLFDREYVFGSKRWWDFKIPQGTVVPESLRIQYTHRSERHRADHYQIEPAAHRMPVGAYKGALDNLARNAVEKLHRDAHAATSTRGT